MKTTKKKPSNYKEIILSYTFVDGDRIKSSWRKKARAIMSEVLLDDNIPNENKLKEIDKRYPLSLSPEGRSSIWLQERKIVIEAIKAKENEL